MDTYSNDGNNDVCMPVGNQEQKEEEEAHRRYYNNSMSSFEFSSLCFYFTV